MGSMKTCSRCVMDDSHGKVDFDVNGICEFCRKFAEAQSQRSAKQSLDSLLAKIRQKKSRSGYHCLLGVSGGVDSSYLAFLCKKYEINPLLFHLDNGWNTSLAVSNIEIICSKFNFDLVTYVIDWQEFRDIQRAFILGGLPNLEAPSDHAIFASLRKIARKHGITTILTGVNDATEQLTVSGKFGRDFRDGELIRSVHRKHGSLPLRTFPLETFWKRLVAKKVRPTRELSLLNYIHYNKQEAESELVRCIGYVPYPGKHGESIMTRFNQYVYLPKKFGLDIRKIHYSNLIFSQQMTRQEAVRALQDPPLHDELLREDTAFVLKKLGITEETFSQILAGKPGSYLEYHNSEKYEAVYDAFSQGWLKLRGRLLGKN